MTLSPRERQVVSLLRAQPMLDAAGLARSLGTSKGAVAVVLSSLSAKGEIVGRGYVLRDEPWVVVVGGAAMDVKARSLGHAQLRTSNPGVVTQAPGGVGRNIAEGLARLGSVVHLIATVGDDSAGRELLTRTSEAGVLVDHVRTVPGPTGTYLALLDCDGELVAAVSDLAATLAMDVAQASRSRELIAASDVAVIDANVSTDLAEWVLSVAADGGVRVVLEPVSVAKAARLAPLLRPELPVFAMTPNLDELGSFVGRVVPGDEASIVAAASELHARGVAHVWVSRGAAGSLLASADGTLTRLDAAPANVVDVTGAGDAMTAGFVHGLMSGVDPATAARHGHVAAAITVASPYTVPPDLGPAFRRALSNTTGENR